MAMTNESTARINHVTQRVNLYDFGYETSGSVKGDPDVYAAYLERIINGDLVEEGYQGFSEDEKQDRILQIKELERKKNELEEENAEIETEIKQKEKTIEECREDLLKIREVRANDTELLKTETFSPVKFSVNAFLLLTLSIYLFFFYVSAAFKALYVDFEGIAESIASGAGVGSIMPGAYELSQAIQYNYLLFLVPFVFYAFGWAFHIILELKSQLKYIFLSALVIVTFTVDFLLALIIHNNTESAKELMGLNAEHWSQSSTFYIILFLGFLVYVIWSILLDSLLREWDKRNITSNIKKIIKHHQKDINILQSKISDLTDLKRQISDYRDDVSIVMYGNLKRYIDQFTSGWITYLSPSNMKDVKNQCMRIKKDFEDRNNIKKGEVKVVGRRKL